MAGWTDHRPERRESRAPVNARRKTGPQDPVRGPFTVPGPRWYSERTARSLMANGARIRGKDVQSPRKDLALWKRRNWPTRRDERIRRSRRRVTEEKEKEREREKERMKEGGRAEASSAEAGRAPGRHYLLASSDCAPLADTFVKYNPERNLSLACSLGSTRRVPITSGISNSESKISSFSLFFFLIPWPRAINIDFYRVYRQITYT